MEDETQEAVVSAYIPQQSHTLHQALISKGRRSETKSGS